MIKTKVTTRSEIPKLLRKARRANIENIGHGAAAIRITARRSIRRRKKASAAGSPPSTKAGRYKSAILYAVNRRDGSAVIGPSVKVAGTSAAAHEHGGRYKGDRFDRRPFMGPALAATRDRLPAFWAGSVK